ncbi:hypothetical protein CC86DRAFT_455115 [Ophiobolus disseminans]|uniref:Uncharacterized protein n=1 Tax=Ophiobolus disseminans TaxID=1469910 RepID=A0A6A7A3X7_9PLEO|nr:hypothetical protein CC86DRAFT_455115 [Ophiobolus disseminans]
MEGRGVHGNASLANVGPTMASARKVTKEKFGNRKKCDTCMFLSRGAGRGCIPQANKACRDRFNFSDRPYCCWTPGIPATFVAGEKSLGNSFQEVDSRGDTDNIRRRGVLCGRRGWTGTALLAAEPITLEIDAGEERDEEDLRSWQVPRIKQMRPTKIGWTGEH